MYLEESTDVFHKYGIKNQPEDIGFRFQRVTLTKMQWTPKAKNAD